jgi:hypothetical protein
LSEIEGRYRNDTNQLGALPRDQCGQIGGTTKDGRRYQQHVCKSDRRIAPLETALKTTLADRDKASAALEQAIAARKPLDRTVVDHDVAVAETNHRENLLHSQLHSFVGMAYGVGPKEVTDAQINAFLRIFVFLPAIFAAFASSFVAITAVHRIEPETISFDPEGADYLLNPLYQAVLNETMAQVVGKQKRDAGESVSLATIGELS